MYDELLQAIKQISEELSQTSGWDIASVVIGGISILLTIVVLVYNHISIKLTQRSVQQAVNLQMFEKRLELYNAIADDEAFYSAPLSLKIAYNEQVYHLYSDIVALCEKRWENIVDYAVHFRADSLYNKKHGNVCSELYEEYAKGMQHQIRLRDTEHLTAEDKKKVTALEKHKADTDLIHQEICDKYAQLEEKMRTILEQSIDL